MLFRDTCNMIKLYLKSKAMTTLRIQGEAYLWVAEMRRTRVGADCWQCSSQH